MSIQTGANLKKVCTGLTFSKELSMKLARLFTVISLVVVFTFATVLAAQAAPAFAHAAQEPAPVPSLDDLFTTLKNLGGFALLVTALVNAGKKVGWVPDGSAPTASLVLNGLGLLSLIILQISGNFNLVPILDQNAGALANVLNAVLALVFQVYVSRKGHDSVLAGMPFIGKSFSGRKAGEGTGIADLIQYIEE